MGWALIGVVGLALILVGAGFAVLQTSWGREQVRRLAVRAANRYLAARLDIGRIGGSLLRGVELDDIRLTRDGRTLISIERVAVSYTIPELLGSPLLIRRVSVTRPRVAAARQPDGRWDLATLVRQPASTEEAGRPGRPIDVQAVEVRDGTVVLADEVSFGAAHIPTRYERVDATLSFRSDRRTWTVGLGRISFQGLAPDLTVTNLAGTIENGPDELTFRPLRVTTPRSSFTVAGRIVRSRPADLELAVHADRFAFQEWGGILHGLRDIAVDARFDARLDGPASALAANLTFASNAGDIRGTFTLDATVPGWLGRGTVDVARIDLARWLNNPDRASNITGRVGFDLALGFGRHFPRGSYRFDGAHAMFMGYAGDDVHARGVLTATEAQIQQATATAYGARIEAAGSSIDLAQPYAYHFAGRVDGLDLRRLPQAVPVPHVESGLSFDYDVTGTFSRAVIAGTARFRPSELLGASLGEGFVGTIDTRTRPIAYTAEGEIDHLDIRRFGEGLDVGWMRDPRYAGTVDAYVRAAGSGSDRVSLQLHAEGRIHRASLAAGRIGESTVAVDIAGGTLRTSFDGAVVGVNPAVVAGGGRYDGSLTGTARFDLRVRDLLLRSPEAGDYDVDGALTLRDSRVGSLAFDRLSLDGGYHDAAVSIRRLDVSGPALEGSASGSIATAACARECASDLVYEIRRADLGALGPILGGRISGLLRTAGRLTGPADRPQAAGEATLDRFAAPDVEARVLVGTYDVSTSGTFDDASGRAEMKGSSVTLFGRRFEEGRLTVGLSRRQVVLDAGLQDAQGRAGSVSADVIVSSDRHEVSIRALSVGFGAAAGPEAVGARAARAHWELASGGTPPVVSWMPGAISLSPMTFVGPTGDQRLDVSGSWRSDGQGALTVTASRVALETLQGALGVPARYGGTLDATAVVRGTRRDPIVSGRITIVAGRILRFGYERLEGAVDYAGGDFVVDLQLDQSPGVSLTAQGRVPAGLFNSALPERPIDLAVRSTPVELGLVQGLTDVVRDVSGRLQLDVRIVGTSRDPHAQGRIDLADAAFVLAATGVRYQNGRAAIRLSADRVDVEALHVEDASGRPLEVRGSLATHERRVSDLSIDVAARRFQVLGNDFGRVDVDAALSVRGPVESPQIRGDVSIVGGAVNVTQILQRALLGPYATAPIAAETPPAVLNPWQRLGLDIALHFPQPLRLTGENLQVAAGTPIGLGNVNVRAAGDLYLYKDPGGPLSVTGSLDQMAGTYEFQGRRFDIDERNSSINFRGDLDPDLYVTMTRVVTGVETRVTITGDLRNPELHLSSVPPLEPSDVLALIVFNTSANALTAPQQQELAVRAATIAAGFLARPVVSAIERSLGLDILAIEPASGVGGGAQLTVGEEIAPGLVARFSRQFGQNEFNQAEVEYTLSRLLRIRATFSDATSAILSPFFRVERAGVDLLFFFSF